MERRNENKDKQSAPTATQADNRPAPSVDTTVKAPATTTAEKTVIPPRPRMSELAIMKKLKRQNRAIHTQEVEKELIDEDLILSAEIAPVPIYLRHFGDIFLIGTFYLLLFYTIP